MMFFFINLPPDSTEKCIFRFFYKTFLLLVSFWRLLFRISSSTCLEMKYWFHWTICLCKVSGGGRKHWDRLKELIINKYILFNLREDQISVGDWLSNKPCYSCDREMRMRAWTYLEHHLHKETYLCVHDEWIHFFFSTYIVTYIVFLLRISCVYLKDISLCTCRAFRLSSNWN